ncbi:MAG: DUF6785 family protein [Candidatus Latescibacterota bacterium]|nr:DUF6785 family protein [Candidatus Latescibacterota bacterium]
MTASTNHSTGQTSPFSMRGLLTGVILSIAIGVIAPYGIVFNYYWIGFNPSSPGALFFFFVLTFMVNAIVAVLGRNVQLSKADLVMIYCMLLMAVTVPTWGLMFFLIGTLVYPFYYATPENNYVELFHDFIPSWMVPQDFQAIKDYYEGLPQGAAVPWGVWVEPMGWWLALIVAMSLMLICMSAILHRQWSVHERLTYPMVQLPQNMIEKEEGASIAPFFKDGVMWLGFFVPFTLLSLNALNHYWPIVPQYNPSGRFSLFNQTLHLPIALNLAWVGFFYLVNLEITFSIWFFYVLSKVQEGVFSTLGIASTERLSAYEYSQPADLTHQASGAVIVLVLYGLWGARTHLKEVVQKLWDPDGGVDDSEELLRYRTALWLFCGSLLFVAVWLWRSGVPIVVLPVLLVVSVIFFILVARVVAASGVATARSPIVPAYFVISGLGTSILGAKGLVALNFTFIWQGESRTSPMVAAANGLKLAEMIPGSKTRLFWGLVLALICSLLGAAYMTLKLAYTYGAINLSLLDWAGAHGWPYIGPTMTDMPDANMRGWFFKGVGAVTEGFLMWAQHRWHWWPFHPIGFAVAVGWLTSQIWFSALICWILKGSIVRFGGVNLFQRLKPFFLGLILGEVAVSGVWGIIYVITAEKGRWITNM